MMQDVFDRLRTLQEILSRKFEIEKELQELPRALTTKTELLNRLKKSYIDKSAQYDEMKEKITALEQKLTEAEHQREEFEKQMDVIKTQREYETLDKAIRDASEKEQQLRKEVQKEQKTFEEMGRALEREESMITQQEEELAGEQDAIKQETQKRKESLESLKGEEQEVVPGLEDEIVFKFERIIRSKSGVGIVPVRKGVCTGCHMILPNQFVNDVRTGEKILFCPYCSRILFYQAEEEDQFFAEMEAESLADLEDFEIDDEDFDEESDEEDTDDEYDEESGSDEGDS